MFFTISLEFEPYAITWICKKKGHSYKLKDKLPEKLLTRKKRERIYYAGNRGYIILEFY